MPSFSGLTLFQLENSRYLRIIREKFSCQACSLVFGNRMAEYGIFISTLHPFDTIFDSLCQTPFQSESKSSPLILKSDCTPAAETEKTKACWLSLYVPNKTANRSVLPSSNSSRTPRVLIILSGSSYIIAPTYTASSS